MATSMNMIVQLAIFVLAHATAWFVVALVAKRNDVADVGWGLGFILLAMWLILPGPPSLVEWLVLVMVALWGVRLSLHISQRLFRTLEDFRYATWRREWGRYFLLRSFLQVYLLQNLILLVVSTPIILIAMSPPSFGVVAGIGLTVWLLGFWIQYLADRQLAVFIRNPQSRGQVLTTGLWRHSRHPNYLGEIMMWSGIAVIALPVPMGWLGLVSPALLTWLLRYVSGVPLLEAKMTARPGWEEYRRATPVIVPWKWLLAR